MKKQLSTQQQAALDWVQAGTGSLNLVARAGCGKTYTLIEMVKLIVAEILGTIFVGAYSKDIAEELKSRLKALGICLDVATAGTMHSAGLRAWSKFVGTFPKIEGDKVRKILVERLSEDDNKLYASFAIAAVSLAKQRAFGVLCNWKDRSKWEDIVDHFGLDDMLPEQPEGITTQKWNEVDHIGRAIDISIKAFRASAAVCRAVVDYDDMILAPLLFNAPVQQYSFVALDEAQDTNPARRALAMRMLKKGGRMIAVGDPHQAIFGFTGADADSMDLIAEEMGSIEMPLTLTYRCPKKVVALAQTWVKDIEAHATAPEGIVRAVFLDPNMCSGLANFWDEKFSKDDVILCRNTAPLVSLAYKLLNKGIACQIEGRDIAEGLVKLTRRWKVKRLNTLRDRLRTYKQREIAKWTAKGKEDRAEYVEQQVDTMNILIDNAQAKDVHTLDGLRTYIYSLFGNTKPGQKAKVLTLSTIHKAKGREWPRVYLLGRNEYMPSKWARKAWQVQQEANLCYVAVTRAINELVEVVV